MTLQDHHAHGALFKLIEEARLLTRQAIREAQAEANPDDPELPLRLLDTLDRHSKDRLPGISRHAKLRDDRIKDAT
jgi:hypothetical protein